MTRALVVHPDLRPHGGGHAVAAWTLQALRETCDLSVLTLKPVDYAGLNRTFGTSLGAGDFAVIQCPRRWQLLTGLVPSQGALLETSVLMRRARRLDGFDVIISTHDEMDFGRPGIQYVHYPHAYGLPEPQHRGRLHRLPGAIAAYRAVCQWISPVAVAHLRLNLTLANSHYVADRIRDVYGVEATVVPPPVPGGFPDVPWASREPGFVCIGRLAPVKQLADAVAIVEAVRGRGHAVQLHIIGNPENAAYEARLRALAETRRGWMSLHVGLSRDEMVALVTRQRYGLHPQVGEPFGIAVAELMRAGCVTFAASPGGPVEILGHQGLVFQSTADAVELIDRALKAPGRLDQLRRHLAGRRDVFSEVRFVREMRETVERFVASVRPPTDSPMPAARRPRPESRA